MKPLFEMRRWVCSLALAAIATAASSPAAHADHWRRYKGEPAYYPAPEVRHVHYAPQRVVYLERRSDAAPVFAALIGGLVIGNALAHAVARAPVVEPAYYYWDPSCDVRYSSLPVYDSRYCYRHHPKVLRVVSVETGEYVDTVVWHDGGWRSEPRWYDDDDWGDRGDRDN